MHVSKVPILATVTPGNPDERRYISVPQTLQKWFVTTLPLSTPSERLYSERLSKPRTWLSEASLMMTPEANIDAVIFLQSVQWQVKVPRMASGDVD